MYSRPTSDIRHSTRIQKQSIKNPDPKFQGLVKISKEQLETSLSQVAILRSRPLEPLTVLQSHNNHLNAVQARTSSITTQPYEDMVRPELQPHEDIGFFANLSQSAPDNNHVNRSCGTTVTDRLLSVTEHYWENGYLESYDDSNVGLALPSTAAAAGLETLTNNSYHSMVAQTAYSTSAVLARSSYGQMQMGFSSPPSFSNANPYHPDYPHGTFSCTSFHDIGGVQEPTWYPKPHPSLAFHQSLEVPAISNHSPATPSLQPFQDEEVSFSSNHPQPAIPHNNSIVSNPQRLSQPFERAGATITNRRKITRKRFEPKELIETNNTRKLGACVLCSKQRVRCKPNPANPYGICLRCLDDAGRRIHRIPCLRYRLTEAALLDHGSCPRETWSRRWKEMKVVDIQVWDSEQTKKILVTQDIGGSYYSLKVRKFIPMPGDATARKWKINGVEQEFKCSPYAIANMSEAARTLSSFVDKTLEEAIEHYIPEKDELLRRTYQMALKYSKTAQSEEGALLRSSLRLWNASRMESRSERIIGHETLGMQHQSFNPECLNYGKILLPPVLTAQLEVIMTAKILQPEVKEVLRLLTKLMKKQQKRQSWLAIYLSIFILLHSCSLLMAGDVNKAIKQGLPGFFRPSLMKELHHGTNILMGHFHYWIEGSFYPFTMDWSSKDKVGWEELDEEQKMFMVYTTAEVDRRAKEFQQIREQGQPGDDYYFISQLYVEGWSPSPNTISKDK